MTMLWRQLYAKSVIDTVWYQRHFGYLIYLKLFPLSDETFISLLPICLRAIIFIYKEKSVIYAESLSSV